MSNTSIPALVISATRPPDGLSNGPNARPGRAGDVGRRPGELDHPRRQFGVAIELPDRHHTLAERHCNSTVVGNVDGEGDVAISGSQESLLPGREIDDDRSKRSVSDDRDPVGSGRSHVGGDTEWSVELDRQRGEEPEIVAGMHPQAGGHTRLQAHEGALVIGPRDPVERVRARHRPVPANEHDLAVGRHKCGRSGGVGLGTRGVPRPRRHHGCRDVDRCQLVARREVDDGCRHRTTGLGRERENSAVGARTG